MPRKKEIEFLIAKYKADIAALEDRAEDLLRRIQILENLIPTVLVWYMWKVSQANREVPFPQHDSEGEAKEKLDHLENILGDLQEADKLLKEEEKIMRKRINELEESLADSPEEYPEKMLDIQIPRSKKPSKSDLPEREEETEDQDLEALEEQKSKLDELLQGEDTDWKMVCEDLLKQVSDLNDKLKNSSQKLKESKDHVKHLEDEYSKLEKELQSKIQLLEKKTEKPRLVSEVVNKTPEKDLEEDLESKAALTAMQEALAEVRSVRESLSKSPTPSKEGYTEALEKVPEVEDSALLPAEVSEAQMDGEPEESLPKSVTLSPEEVITPGASTKLSKISIAKPQIFEPEVALAADTTEPATATEGEITGLDEELITPEEMPLEILPELELPKLPQSPIGTPQSSIVPTDAAISIEAVSEPTEAKMSETPATPEILEGQTEILTTGEDMVGPSEELVSKESSFKPAAEETSVTPELPEAPAEPIATVEDMVVSPDETILKDIIPEETEAEIPVSSPETPIQEPPEDMFVPPEKTISKEAIFEHAEGETPTLETEILEAPVIEAIEEGIPPQKPISEEAILEASIPEIPSLEPQLTLESPQPSAEPATSAADMIVPPEQKLSIEAISEQPEAEKDEPEKLEPTITITPDTIEEAVIPPETLVAPPEKTVVEDVIYESDGVQTPTPETQIDSDVPQVHIDAITGAEGMAPSDTKVSKEIVSEIPEAKISVSEPLESPDIIQIPQEPEATTDVSPETTVPKEDIYKPDMETPEPETSVELPPISAEPLGVAEDVISPLEKTVSKEALLEPTDISEAQMVESETPASGVPEEVIEEGIPVESPITLGKPSIPTDEDISEEPLVVPKEELLETTTELPSTVPPMTEGLPVTDRLSGEVAEPITIASEVEHLQEPLIVAHAVEPAEVEPVSKLTPEEIPPLPVLETIVGEGKAAEEIIVPVQVEPVATSPEIASRQVPSGVGSKQEPGLPTGTPSVPSLAAQTLQGKLRVKDHLIKSVADELRDLARNNVWTDRTSLENAVKAGPFKTYDFDRNILHCYLKGEEPKNYTATMKGDADSSSNPLKVKIARKVDKDSLLIEWGPPPSAEVVGFQIFLNGQFMYWVHSSKRNLALLHPLDLRLILEIAVSPINVRGDIIFRSIVIYKPD